MSVRSPARAAWTEKESVMFSQTVPAGTARQGGNRGGVNRKSPVLSETSFEETFFIRRGIHDTPNTPKRHFASGWSVISLLQHDVVPTC